MLAEGTSVAVNVLAVLLAVAAVVIVGMTLFIQHAKRQASAAVVALRQAERKLEHEKVVNETEDKDVDELADDLNDIFGGNGSTGEGH